MAALVCGHRPSEGGHGDGRTGPRPARSVRAAAVSLCPAGARTPEQADAGCTVQWRGTAARTRRSVRREAVWVIRHGGRLLQPAGECGGARGARVGGAHGGRAWGARRWLPPPNFRGGDAVRAIRLLSPWAVVRIPVPAFPFCPTSHSLPQAPSSRAWRPEVHLPTGWAWGGLHLAPAEGLKKKCIKGTSGRLVPTPSSCPVPRRLCHWPVAIWP